MKRHRPSRNDGTSPLVRGVEQSLLLETGILQAYKYQLVSILDYYKMLGGGGGSTEFIAA